MFSLLENKSFHSCVYQDDKMGADGFFGFFFFNTVTSVGVSQNQISDDKPHCNYWPAAPSSLPQLLASLVERYLSVPCQQPKTWLASRHRFELEPADVTNYLSIGTAWSWNPLM